MNKKLNIYSPSVRKLLPLSMSIINTQYFKVIRDLIMYGDDNQLFGKSGKYNFLNNNIHNYIPYYNLDLPHRKRMEIIFDKLKEDYDDHEIKMKKLASENAITSFLEYNEHASSPYNLKYGGKEFLNNNIENYMEYFNMDLPPRKRMGMMLEKLKEDFYKDHDIKIKKINAETAKRYYKENKEKLSKWASEKIVCKCGAIICRGYKSGHEKTKKHLAYLEIKKN